MSKRILYILAIFYIFTLTSLSGHSIKPALSACPPSAPTLSATFGDGVVNLSWTSPQSCAGYQNYTLLRGTSPGNYDSSRTINGSVLHSWDDTPVTNGTRYYYVVRERCSSGEGCPYGIDGPNSNEVNGVPGGSAYAQSSYAYSQSSYATYSQSSYATYSQSSYTIYSQSSYTTSPSPAGLVQCGGVDQPVCDKGEFYKLLSRLFKYLVFISGIVVVLSIAMGGFFMLISGGSEEKVSYGKKTMRASIVGLIIVLTAWVMVNTIITVFTNCHGAWYVFEEFSCSQPE